jgi:hypothetical protein
MQKNGKRKAENGDEKNGNRKTETGNQMSDVIGRESENEPE